MNSIRSKKLFDANSKSDLRMTVPVFVPQSEHPKCEALQFRPLWIRAQLHVEGKSDFALVKQVIGKAEYSIRCMRP